VTGRARLRGEEGIALTVAIMSLALMLMLGSVALKQAVAALHHTTEETNIKRALQAADAAIDDATYAVARADIGNTLDVDVLNPTSVVNQNCVLTPGTVGGIDLATLDPLTQADPSGNKWCPETTPQTTSDNATYSYRISQLVKTGAGSCGSGSAVNLDRDVVGVGRAGGQVRRVKAHLNASLALLSSAAVQAAGTGSGASSPFTMSGTATILGNAESNGAITASGVNVVSGNATPGEGYSVSGVVPGGSSSAACQKFTIPEVDVPTTGTTTSFTKSCVSTLLVSLASCAIPLNLGDAVYTAATRTLTITGTGRATLVNGGSYKFCSIVVKGNGILQIPAGSANTRIFLEDPSDCPAGMAGAGTISVTESARIVNCHLPTQPESLQIYAVGNASTATTQTIAASALSVTALTNVCGAAASGLGVPLTLIAPHSTLALGASTNIAGQVAAEKVQMTNAAKVTPVNALINISRLGSNPVLPLYKATNYVECTGRSFADLPAAAPSQGC
jgi:type II secretory pathway pseudopilin PulG